MFNSNSTPFTMPVQPAYCGTGNNGGLLGGDDSWLALIIILALFGGWGGNGFGGFGGNGSCATQADVRSAVDQQTLISKIDQQTYGMADSFNSINSAIMGGFHGVDNAICTLGYQNQQGFNTLAHQLADCCCTTQRSIDGINYNMATQACDTRNAIANSTRDIIDNANANNRALLDFLVNDKIATLQAENQSLKFKASQAEQNAYLVNELKPCPSPAYIVPNPNCCYNQYATNYGAYVVGA